MSQAKAVAMSPSPSCYEIAGYMKRRFDACVYAKRCRKIVRVDVEHMVASAQPACAAGARELKAARAVEFLVRGPRLCVADSGLER